MPEIHILAIVQLRDGEFDEAEDKLKVKPIIAKIVGLFDEAKIKAEVKHETIHTSVKKERKARTPRVAKVVPASPGGLHLTGDAAE